MFAAFNEWFKRAMGSAIEGPFPYQERLATGQEFPRLLNIPTGCGKTAAVILSWLWRRRFHPEESVRAATPRRLIYCLPMRVLVEQTRNQAIKWLRSLDLLFVDTKADSDESYACVPERGEQREGVSGEQNYRDDDIYVPEWGKQREIPVFTIMGGEPKFEWEAFPEREAILVGTQDMLLSRALNRGYAARPARWPLHFGLLNLDTLWIMDEIQLMGVGRTSSVQLQHFFDRNEAPQQLALPRQTLWMSATLGAKSGEELRPTWMETPELSERKPGSIARAGESLSKPEKKMNLSNCKPEVIACADADDFKREEFNKRWKAPKSLKYERELTVEHEELVSLILNEVYAASSRVVLVFLNQVSRAVCLYQRLREGVEDRDTEVLLIHGRFRPLDRRNIEKRLPLSEEHLRKIPSCGRIVVTTQVLEAGVDLDSNALFTEICPWPSLIQRLGRLNRRGENPSYREVEKKSPAPAVVFEVPEPQKKGDKKREEYSLPYESKALEEARSKLKLLSEIQENNLNPETLLKNASKLTGKEERDKLREASPEALSKIKFELAVEGPILRRFDLDDFFDTDPDLAGGYTDVSDFVRVLDRDVDIYVAWRRIEDGNPVEKQPPLHPEELCAVPFYEAKQFFKKQPVYILTLATKRSEGAAWRRTSAKEIRPGDTVMVDLTAGCYSDDTGWLGSKSAENEPRGKLKCWIDRWDRQNELSRRAWASRDENGTLVFVDLDDRIEGVRAIGEDPLTFKKKWMTLEAHLNKAESEAGKLMKALDITNPIAAAVTKAARWHDVGKALERRVNGVLKQPFQEILGEKSEDGHPLKGVLYAKSNSSGGKSSGFRHEAASTLAYLANTNPENLIAYLILSHHGKVRMLPLPWRDTGLDVCGVCSGDQLPASAVPGEGQRNVILTPSVLSPSQSQPGWQGRVEHLLRSHGLFTLAYLEGLIQIADWRAS